MLNLRHQVDAVDHIITEFHKYIIYSIHINTQHLSQRRRIHQQHDQPLTKNQLVQLNLNDKYRNTTTFCYLKIFFFVFFGMFILKINITNGHYRQYKTIRIKNKLSI